ncbi:MAG: peroxide stress protein YaaA [Clostridia bacterium]|nr:peroxide stress protein YaaA [Clostridia bacterium]
MRIILAPAKKMNVDLDTLEPLGLPKFIDKTEEILSYLLSLSNEELQKLWSCNDKIAEQNIERLAKMDLRNNLTPAVLAYEGIAYQYMAPSVFEFGQFDYVQEHLRILSGFYGVLKPMDGVTPYRLEMQAKAKVSGTKNLYDYWGRSLYEEVRDESGVIINLASKEYSKCIEKYLTDKDKFVTCEFVERHNGKFVTKATYAKMARGEMVRFMAENKIENAGDIKNFDRLNYKFLPYFSDENNYLFERTP